MPAPDAREERPASERRKRQVVARVLQGRARDVEKRFAATFTVGRDATCGVQVLEDGIAPQHLQVMFDGIQWWVRALDGAAGSFKDGKRIQVVPLADELTIALGRSGCIVSLRIAEAAPEAPAPAEPAEGTGGWSAAPLTEEQIIERYLRPASGAPAGKQTMMFRRAFEQVHRKSSRRYKIAVAAVLVALAGAAAVIAYQRHKLEALRETGEKLFYTMKTIELQSVKLDELVAAGGNPELAAELAARREKLRRLESEYDAFVQELGVYAKATERQRHILRMARRFGECEVNIPKQFVGAVERYIERWRRTDRLASALRRAKERGYAARIVRTLEEHDLPPQYLYLALQESNFDDRAVGPPTRYGFAKGMWQFITPTGRHYGLRIGPLFDQPVFDPQDERFQWQRATTAAARYIRFLQSTEAQASGLLALASYNWGENKVRELIAAMPENPQERNFWRLLARNEVPDETYDYVLSIFSAAVICENPRLFGFDVECPPGKLAPGGAGER